MIDQACRPVSGPTSLPRKGGARGLTVRLTGLLLALCMVLEGCVAARVTYISADDPCSRYREPFVQIIERQQAEIAGWAKIGAAAGLAVGTAAGAASRKGVGGVLVGALVGTLVGAISGATIGYFSNLSERSSSTSALRAAVQNDAVEDATAVDGMTAALADLNDCRLDTVGDIAAGVQSGVLERPAARQELERAKVMVAADNDLIDRALSGLNRRSEIYVSALEKSGASDSDAYLARVKTYRPVIEAPSYSVARGRRSETLRTGSRIRSGPGTGHPVITTLPAGSRVSVVGTSGSWSRVEYGDGTGFVATRLLGKPPRKGTSAGGRLAVKKSARPKAESGVEALGLRMVELDEAQSVHVDSVNASIADAQQQVL